MIVDDIYRKLQQHIDNQAVGYPELKSGADIRMLKLLYTQEEARAALYLSYKYEPIEQIYERAKDSGIPKEKFEGFLTALADKGAIGRREREGMDYFKCLPLAVGWYEAQTGRQTPEFVKEFKTITDDFVFGKAFLGIKVPQMRTIPIEKSITPENYVATYDSVKAIIEEVKGPIVIHICPCRETREIEGEPCKKTSRKEVCMSFRDSAQACIRAGIGREISKEEALEILRKNQEEGLVLQPSNAQEPEFICSCCSCCCGTLVRVANVIPQPAQFWASNYQAKIDPDLCTGCQTCVDRCQVKAIKYKKAKNISIVNLNRCIGCGLCVETCPSDAIMLHNKETELVPPTTDDELYDILMEHRNAS